MASRAAPKHAPMGHLDHARIASIEDEIARIADYLGRGDRRAGPPQLHHRGREGSSAGFVDYAAKGPDEQSSAPVLRRPRRAAIGHMDQRRPKGRARDRKVDASKMIGWGVFAATLSFSVAVLVT